jgi:HD-GYP domain-containing protein (c-di-GMP phosphodiesterase class II)
MTTPAGTSAPLPALVIGFSKALDLVNPLLTDHHARSAYVAAAVATELDWPLSDRSEIILAALLHDCGALSTLERLGGLRFDLAGPFRHAEVGYVLLSRFAPFAAAADAVRYHHIDWNSAAARDFVPASAHLLHLADRVSVLVDTARPLREQATGILGAVKERAGTSFFPAMAEAFLRVGDDPAFWEGLVSPQLNPSLLCGCDDVGINLDLEGLRDLARFLCRVIDFRSRFTATHSSGVAASAGAIAGLLGVAPDDRTRLEIAGYLHDLGKLAVPEQILEKPGRLDAEELVVVRRHAQLTMDVLDAMPGLGEIAAWAALHHERLDGRGYPFGLSGESLSLGSRIVAVADVFTALIEDRPYRLAAPDEKVRQILSEQATAGALDHSVVAAALDNYQEIKAHCQAQQTAAHAEYEALERLSLRSADPRPA